MPADSFTSPGDNVFYDHDDDVLIDLDAFDAPIPGPSRGWVTPPGAYSDFGFDPSDETVVPLSQTSKMEQQLLEEIESTKKHVSQIEEDIANLQRLKAVREHDIKSATLQLENLRKGNGITVLNVEAYETGSFEWDRRLMDRSKSVFGIKKFRFCQRGVCNAVMDKRDVFCVMPTGGGKSLTYQLPALLQAGCTLVISPLLALISDQVHHLGKAGVEAIRFTGAISEPERKNLFTRLYATASGVVERDEQEIKLCYVTPEMLLRNTKFKGVLKKLNDSGKLARIVIDEAHCVSEMGHDFRKDYHELRVLRKFYPNVPILALSATCTPAVLTDVLNILGLKSVTCTSDPKHTLFFSSPLYRKNLHYLVLPKPEDSKGTINAMSEYILNYHPDETGIIYCLRQKDTESVAKDLAVASGGRIKTGVYHAGRSDFEKERLHEEWRKGKIKVVCATIAFGLGIDKADVRFVLHHSMSKSVESYYQESGRAGRDGKDSDCVLYYRPQDCTSLFSISASQKDGRDKVLSMIRFSQNVSECRKLLFSNYFSVASQLNKTFRTAEEIDASMHCGHCDNCTRNSVDEEDVTQDAWKIVKAATVSRRPQTLKQLATYARGLGGKSLQDNVDLKPVLGTPIRLKQLETEHLIAHLMTEKYLTEKLDPNEHTVNVYIVPGPLSNRILSMPRERLPNDKLSIKFAFMDFAPRKVPEKKSGNGKPLSNAKSRGKRRKRSISSDNSETGSEMDAEAISDGEAEEIERDLVANAFEYNHVEISDGEDGDDTTPNRSYNWSHSMRKPPAGVKRRRLLPPNDEIQIVPDSEGEGPVYISSD